MIVHEIFGITILVLVGLLPMFLLGWLFKRLKKKAAAGATIGFFLAIIPLAFLYVSRNYLYVIQPDETVSSYWVWGSENEKSVEGKNYQVITPEWNTGFVINGSKKVFYVEEVIYGFATAEDIRLEPSTSATLDSKISYLLGDTPPITIEVDYGQYGSRYWLRSAKDYESDDHFTMDKLEGLRETLEDKIEDSEE